MNTIADIEGLDKKKEEKEELIRTLDKGTYCKINFTGSEGSFMVELENVLSNLEKQRAEHYMNALKLSGNDIVAHAGLSNKEAYLVGLMSTIADIEHRNARIEILGQPDQRYTST